MASIWKKLKKFLEKGKKKGLSQAVKTLENSQESWEKEVVEKNSELHPKVVEIYKSATTIVTKKLLKAPTESAVKENPAAVQDVLADLAKAGFPGAQALSEAGAKHGAALIPGPIVFLFEKTSTFLVQEELPAEEEAVGASGSEEKKAAEEEVKKVEEEVQAKEEEVGGDGKGKEVVEEVVGAVATVEKEAEAEAEVKKEVEAEVKKEAEAGAEAGAEEAAKGEEKKEEEVPEKKEGDDGKSAEAPPAAAA